MSIFEKSSPHTNQVEKVVEELTALGLLQPVPNVEGAVPNAEGAGRAPALCVNLGPKKSGSGRPGAHRNTTRPPTTETTDTGGQPPHAAASEATPEEQDRRVVIRKSDGAFLYSTFDLAALRLRAR